MPFIKLKSEIPDVDMGAWKIEEEEFFFLTRVKLYENEWQRLALIQHPDKRKEWLSSRLCLKELLKIADTTHVESLNTQTGRPYLSDQSYNISYTHSGSYAGAIASEKYKVSMDIEDLSIIRNRETRRLFMNESELAAYDAAEDPHHLFILVWSAKETLYKLVGEGYSFRDHFFLEVANFQVQDNGVLHALVERDGFDSQYEIRYRFMGPFLLTYTWGRLRQEVALPLREG